MSQTKTQLQIAMERSEHLYVIPEMTHELGKYWNQPSRKEIEIDQTHAVMSTATFRKLSEYSCSSPTGAYAGKMWSRHDGVFDPQCPVANHKWLLCWFGPHPKLDGMLTTFYRIILLSDGDLPK